MRRGIETSENVKCCAGTFIAQGRDTAETCIKNLALMDGKLYRRDFIDSYGKQEIARQVVAEGASSFIGRLSDSLPEVF